MLCMYVIFTSRPVSPAGPDNPGGPTGPGGPRSPEEPGAPCLPGSPCGTNHFRQKVNVRLGTLHQYQIF